MVCRSLNYGSQARSINMDYPWSRVYIVTREEILRDTCKFSRLSLVPEVARSHYTGKKLGLND